MSDYTINYNLILPDKGENYDVEVANTNNKIIDTQLRNKVEKVPGKNLSSNDFTNAYKNKIDSLQNIYKFAGSVDSFEDLPTDAQNGDVYNVIDESKSYAYNDATKSWIELGSAVDVENVITHKYNLILTSTVEAGQVLDIPYKYKVGSNCLDVFYNGERLLLSSNVSGTDGHYCEVGNANSISNQIQLTSDWKAEIGDYFDFVVRGEYSDDT
jgi:hypothetical protein